MKYCLTLSHSTLFKCSFEKTQVLSLTYLVLTRRFNIMIYKNVFIDFTVTYNHETQKHLPQTFL